MKNFVIAIDGQSASGKGTLATRISQHFRCKYLPTGNLYRLVAYKVYQNNLNPKSLEDPKILDELLVNFDLFLLYSDKLNNENIALIASKISQNQELRKRLNQIQFDWVKNNKVAILEGRDIGTVICPKADVKFYLKAHPEERAKRRMIQYQRQGSMGYTQNEILADIRERDYQDSHRENSPLKPADDSHVIDTTKLSSDQVYEEAMRIILKKYNSK